MKVRALSSIRVRGQQGQTVQLSPGETYDLDRDVAETLIDHGEAVGVQDYETQVQPAPETKATDAARDLAEEEGIDLSKVDGSGEDGKILKSDVQDALP